MGNGPSDSDIRNDCNFWVDRFDKVVGAGFKSNDRCGDVSYEWVGSYDARFLTRFRSSNSNRNIVVVKKTFRYSNVFFYNRTFFYAAIPHFGTLL